MNIEEIKSLSNAMLKKLVDCLGLDGDYYISMSNTPIAFTRCEELSRFLTAKSSDLKHFLERINLDDKQKKYLFDTGLIIINREKKDLIANNGFERTDLLVKVVHERIHANRMLLINSQNKESRGISGVFYDDGRFVQSNRLDNDHYVDSSQEILKASIDDASDTIDKYVGMSSKEKEDITTADFEYDYQLEKQIKVDEALVETMAIVANRLYEEDKTDIMEIIRDINANYNSDDIRAITNIILRHNDLELFKWMIDPISYEIGVVNYDFFSKYITEADLNDVEDIRKSSDSFDDDDFDQQIINNRNK